MYMKSWLSEAEAMEFTGRSARTIRRWRQLGLIEVRKVGGRRRYGQINGRWQYYISGGRWRYSSAGLQQCEPEMVRRQTEGFIDHAGPGRPRKTGR